MLLQPVPELLRVPGPSHIRVCGPGSHLQLSLFKQNTPPGPLSSAYPHSSHSVPTQAVIQARNLALPTDSSLYFQLQTQSTSWSSRLFLLKAVRLLHPQHQFPGARSRHVSYSKGFLLSPCSPSNEHQRVPPSLFWLQLWAHLCCKNPQYFPGPWPHPSAWPVHFITHPCYLRNFVSVPPRDTTLQRFVLYFFNHVHALFTYLLTNQPVLSSSKKPLLKPESQRRRNKHTCRIMPSLQTQMNPRACLLKVSLLMSKRLSIKKFRLNMETSGV